MNPALMQALMKAYIEALRRKEQAQPIPMPETAPVDIYQDYDTAPAPLPGNDKGLPLRRQDRIVRT